MLVLKNLLNKKFSRVVVYCLVIKVPVVSCLKRQLLYSITAAIVCQELFHVFELLNSFIAFLYRVSLNIISFLLTFCQDFLQTFFTSFSIVLNVNFPLFCYCKNLHFTSGKTNGEGGIWTLAPLLTTYSLSRGAPSASLGTSPKRPLINIHDIKLIVQYFFSFFYFSCSSSAMHRYLKAECASLLAADHFQISVYDALP